MYDSKSRRRKALRIVKTLEHFLGRDNLKHLRVLDLGASTGIIDSYLAKKFGKVTGIDIDTEAIAYAKKTYPVKNLKFLTGDAMNLRFKDDTFDVVICSHVYEHVPSAISLIEEIYRVLKPGGVCYFAAVNKLWPWEPHYSLPFLSWLPKTMAHLYLKTFRGIKEYYESPLSYWGLENLTKKFNRLEYTQKVLRDPVTFGYNDTIKPAVGFIAWLSFPLLKYLSPTFFWLLIKNRDKQDDQFSNKQAQSKKHSN